MRYQSLWWKSGAVLLALCLLAKLLADIGISEALKRLANSSLLMSFAMPYGTDKEEAWLAGESSVPGSLLSLPETKAASGTPEDEEETGGQHGGLIISLKGILPEINNYTSYQPDWSALFRERWSSVLKKDQPQILIIHTHSCEAYTPSGDDAYEESDPYRTLDKSRSVIRVGDELARAFEDRGFIVVHDREYYDYPGYSGSYTRSLAAVESWLEKYPSIKVVIDLHRDALESGGKTCYSGGGADAAQVMLLITTGEAGLHHPSWKENLKLALEIQMEMEQRYDGFARPLCLSKERYNEQAAPGYMLLEVGTNLNTLKEALEGARLFAECASNVLKDYVQ